MTKVRMIKLVKIAAVMAVALATGPAMAVWPWCWPYCGR